MTQIYLAYLWPIASSADAASRILRMKRPCCLRRCRRRRHRHGSRPPRRTLASRSTCGLAIVDFGQCGVDYWTGQLLIGLRRRRKESVAPMLILMNLCTCKWLCWFTCVCIRLVEALRGISDCNIHARVIEECMEESLRLELDDENEWMHRNDTLAGR